MKSIALKSGIFGLIFCCATFFFLESRAVGFPPPPSELQDGSYVEGEMIVKFKDGVNDDKKEKDHDKYGSKKIKGYDLQIDYVKLKKDLSVKDAIEEYKSDPDVEYAEPNFIFYESAPLIPNDTYYLSQQWNFNNYAVQKAWGEITTGDINVVAAIFDNGVNDYNSTAQTLAPHQDILPLLDNYYGPALNSSDPSATSPYYYHDSDGHGTHIAGIIGAHTNNGIGIAGSNWNITLMNCKVYNPFLLPSGGITVTAVMNCINRIKAFKDNGYNIVAINASWGTPYINDWNENYNYPYNRGALSDYIHGKIPDILFVAAAGNAGNNPLYANKPEPNNDFVPQYPASFNLPNVISVAANG